MTFWAEIDTKSYKLDFLNDDFMNDDFMNMDFMSTDSLNGDSPLSDDSSINEESSLGGGSSHSGDSFDEDFLGGDLFVNGVMKTDFLFETHPVLSQNYMFPQQNNLNIYEHVQTADNNCYSSADSSVTASNMVASKEARVNGLSLVRNSRRSKKFCMSCQNCDVQRPIKIITDDELNNLEIFYSAKGYTGSTCFNCKQKTCYLTINDIYVFDHLKTTNPSMSSTC
jgi:hypothetical protein